MSETSTPKTPICPKCGSSDINKQDCLVGFSRDMSLMCYCGNRTPMLNMMNTKSGLIGVFGTFEEEFPDWYPEFPPKGQQ